VVEALEAARRRAEWEKHEKWLRKLEAGNHDTSKLRANFESEYSLPLLTIYLALVRYQALSITIPYHTITKGALCMSVT